jgi:hypothetical protein
MHGLTNFKKGWIVILMEQICYWQMPSKHKENMNMQTQCYSPVLLRVKLNLILSGDMKKK